MVGGTLAHYEVLELLGSGGMGTVYRARDSKLGRDVALKVLPEGFAEDRERLARLEREARLLAALNHPNIAAIYSLEEVDRTRFLVLELVEGEPLDRRLTAGPLKVQESLEIARQIAEALDAAHRRGIIHRDLKPANIMVSDEGRVKVLDFGLAKTYEASDGHGRDLSHSPTITVGGTEFGVILGTAAYMSPEQARGKALDKRTDTWSFGCVLYEVLTGQKAFDGETVSDALAAILKDDPDWGALPPNLPGAVQALLGRCLQKESDRRLHEMVDARLEIEDALVVWRASDRVGGQPAMPAESAQSARPEISSIAVLPLANLSGDKEQEYFSDGMTEALITDLAKIRALKVISRTSVMRYKGSDASLPAIASELGVDAIVEGSVLRAGDEVRITAQLIDAASDTHLWADSYDRDMTNILSLQREVAQAIVREVKVAVTPEEEEQLADARPVDPEAYEAYLKGRFHWRKIAPEHIETALQYFQRALEVNPDYARAHAGIAWIWLVRADWGIVPLFEALPKAKAAAARALELDESLAEGHHLQAMIKMLRDWDWAGAEAEFRRAIELDASYVDSRIFYSHFLVSMKRFEEGQAEMERALELDPLSSFSQGLWGVLLLHMRRYDEALDQLRKSLRMEPDLPMTLHSHWIVLHQIGEYEQACATAAKFYAALGDQEVPLAITQGYAEAGSSEASDPEASYSAAMRAAAETLVSRASSAYVPPVRIALLYAHAGEKDLALDWLEAGYEERSPDMVYLQLWHWDAISDDARFQEILRRMKFPELPAQT